MKNRICTFIYYYNYENAFKIYCDDYVLVIGTGIINLSPAFEKMIIEFVKIQYNI